MMTSSGSMLLQMIHRDWLVGVLQSHVCVCVGGGGGGGGGGRWEGVFFTIVRLKP